jgi:reverse gyrase
MMMRVRILIAAVATMTAPTAAHACGACVEDKVAATYDHVVIHAAIAKHRQVVFVAVDGDVDGKKIGAQIAAAAPKVRGVVVGTLRTSVAPPAFSFALDAAQTPETAVAAFRKAIADSGVRLTMVRIMRNGTLTEP